MHISTLKVTKSFTILKNLLLVGDTIYVETSTHRDPGFTVDWHYVFLADRTLIGSVREEKYRNLCGVYTERGREYTTGVTLNY